MPQKPEPVLSKQAGSKKTETTMVLTLHDAVFLALRNNTSVISYELDRIIQKYAVLVAKHQFEPNYTLGGTFNYSDTTSTAIGGSHSASYSRSASLTPVVSIQNRYGTTFTTTMTNPTSGQYYNPSLKLEVKQPLLQGLGEDVTEITLRNALDAEEANKLTLKQNIITIVDLIMNEYFAWASAEASLRVDQSTLKNYERNVENDQLQINLGRMAKNDIIQDQSYVAQQKVTIEGDINSLRQAKLTLLNDMGLDSTTPIQLPDNPDFKGAVVKLGGHAVPSLEKCLELTFANEPRYKIAEINLRTAQRSLLSAQDKMRWTLDFTGSVQRGAGSGGDGNAGIESITNARNHAEAAGLGLTVPVDTVTLKGNLLNAEVSLQKTEIAFRNLRRQIEIDVLNKRNAVISGEKKFQLSQVSIGLKRQTVEISKLKHEYGKISSFELIKNQESLSNSEITNVQSAISYLNALRDLNATLGITLDIWEIKLKDFEHAKVE